MNAITQRKALNRAAKIIATFEGGESADGKYRAYYDANGRVWTIGHGETLHVRAGMVWTAAQARRDLRRRLRRDFLPAVKRAIPKGAHPTANQVAATLSFVWNLGVGMLDTSHTFGAAFRAGHFRKAWDSMPLYDESGGRHLAGLTRRRKAERALALRRN